MNNQTISEPFEPFDNTSFESMITASKSRGVENTICKEMKTMLGARLIETSLAGETM